MSEVPDAFWGVIAFAFGAVIGSFLNVVIWRLPRGMSLVRPGSHCPHCNHALRAYENVPLISFLALGAHCSSCHQSISWRYFLVELLTAVTFLALFWQAGPTVLTIAYCAFAGALIAALFIDLELFIIPDEVNIFALLVAVAYDVWAASAGVPGHRLIGGWLPHSILGGAVCAAVFVGIQILGTALFRKDAMGDGDVKLARAIGAMLPLGVALVSFLFAIGAGAVIGVLLLAVRYVREGPARETAAADDGAVEPSGETATPLLAILGYGLLYVTCLDVLLAAAAAVGIPLARRLVQRAGEPAEADEEFVPGPTHIPFGPYMVAGAILSIFVGRAVIDWYMMWAHLVPPGPQ